MAQEKDGAPDSQRDAAPKVKWDTSQMRSSYANVCNAQGTREEVVLLFGISHPSQGEENQREMLVQLSERVILSPFAAKRLATLLTTVVEQYEQRFGKLESVVPQQPPDPKTH